MFFLLTLNYDSTLKRRLIATVSIYMILMTVETAVVLVMQYFDVSILSANSDLALIAGLISIKIISYNVMLFLSNFKMVKNDIKVSSLHWLSIFVIPSGTLISALILITKVNSDNLTGVIINITILFVINVFVFYLYDVLMKSYDERMEKALLQQQNSAYLKQLEIINQSQECLKEFRHNVKNHVLSLKTLIDNNDNNAASEYLNSVFKNIDFSGGYSKSGNSEIDSILNYKLNKAVSCGVITDVSINVPEKLNIRPFDLSVVLGNLIDNAIEAACKCKEKFIKLSVELDRNVLYVSISNSFDGKLNYDSGKLATTKDDKENHGMGLSSVQRSLEKYNGAMELRHKGNTFYVDVLIYNKVYEVRPF
jgi:sensor histidine kinase YesM